MLIERDGNAIGTDVGEFRKGGRRFGIAWLSLGIALAFHVTDEALTDFLSFYNPSVATIRQRIPFLPLPTFTFGVWLTGLIIGILLLFCLSPFAFRGSRFTIALAYPLSVIMFLNGMGHIGGSFYVGCLLPGVYSSPILLLASAYLFVQALNHYKRHRQSVRA